MEQKEENFSSTHVAILDGNKILLLRRSNTDQWMPNRWGLPGGKKEDGETPEENAVRECEEETQLVLNPESLSFLSREEGDAGVHLFYITHEHSGNLKLDFEHDESIWIDLDEVSSLETVPGMGELIKKIKEKQNDG